MRPEGEDIWHNGTGAAKRGMDGRNNATKKKAVEVFAVVRRRNRKDGTTGTPPNFPRG